MAVTVYSAPEEIKLPDWKDMTNWQANDEKYIAELKAHLNKMGYNEPETGKIVRFEVADGYAQYMVAQLKGKCILIHLKLGDAWHYQHIERLLKKDLVANLKQQDAWNKMWI